MNICYIAIDYHRKEGGGGIASYLKSVSQNLTASGHTVIIIAKAAAHEHVSIDTTGAKVYAVEFGNIHYYVHKIPFIGKRISAIICQLEWSLSAWLSVKKILKKNPIDVIESSEAGNLFITLFLARIPLIIKTHGSYVTMSKFSGEKIYLGHKISRAVECWCLRKCSCIVAPSHFQAQEIADELRIPKDKVRVIPNPINPDFIQQSLNLGSRKDADTILYTGRLEYRKGILWLLRSIPYVIEQYPDAKFIFAGGYHMSLSRKLIQKAVDEHHIAQYLDFKGHLEWDEIHELYQTSSIFVLPSYFETFSISCIEAMIFGLPVVTTRAGALPETVVDNVTGILVEPNNAQELARAIVRLLRSPELRARMGEAGRQHVLANFAPEKISAQTLALYEHVKKQAYV
ncbi:MAG: glycosyltransferase family 4 protein [Candidatus Omnitrophica bacterium]|nr:glycosyltransferase family 4 protein [Candidatus Omnitrophota bacterium]